MSARLNFADLKQNKFTITEAGGHGEHCVRKKPDAFVYPSREMGRNAHKPTRIIRDIVAVPRNTRTTWERFPSMHNVSVERRQCVLGFCFGCNAWAKQLCTTEQSRSFRASMPTSRKNEKRRDKYEDDKSGEERCNDLTCSESHDDSIEERSTTRKAPASELLLTVALKRKDGKLPRRGRNHTGSRIGDATIRTSVIISIPHNDPRPSQTGQSFSRAMPKFPRSRNTNHNAAARAQDT